ncbi:hypothetical protein [Streptomyces boninensis]|uniref:hypothetical protein n=1 Tax=Streptomyces boninensis TaxID=2039455 RepID=UPI003B20EA38
MSDLCIDFDMLDSTRKDLRKITRILRKPGEEMDRLDASDMGELTLARRMHDFGDEWSYGIKELGKFSDAAAEALKKIKKSFADLDEDLEKALSKGGKGRGAA